MAPTTGSLSDSLPCDSGERRALRLDFEQVYAQHFDFIYRSVRGLGVPASNVDDVTQEVFLIVHRKLDTLENPQALRGWLFGIARRLCKDHRRAATRRGPQLELDEQREVDVRRNPQIEAANRQALRVVEHFAAKLDDERRAIFFLALVEGLPVAEAAATLGLNVNTTYSRVRVLRQELALLLESETMQARGDHGRP